MATVARPRRRAANQTHVAPWWQTNTAGADNDVVAHTPDPTKYHSTNYEDGPRVGSGPRGLMGAVIPRARNDGSSRGFDHNHAGVIVVDPNAPDGGVVIDPSQLSNEATQDALQQVGYNVGYGRETDQETFAVMAMLGKPIHEAELEDVTPEYLLDTVADGPVKQAAVRTAAHMPNRYAPNSYVTPKSDSEGRQRDLGTSAHQPVRRRVEPVRDAPVISAPPRRPAPTHAKPTPQPQRRAVSRPQPEPEPESIEDPEYLDEQDNSYEEEAPVMAKQGSNQPRVLRPAAQPQRQAPQQHVAVDPLELLQELAAQQGLRLAPAVQQPQRAAPARRRVAELPPEEVYADELPAEEEIIDEQEATFAPPPQSAYNRPPQSAIRRQPRQTPAQQQRERPQVDISSIVEAINLPFVSGVDPEKPKKAALFDLGPGGQLRKRYHDIIKGAECVVLVYDTRYEDGEQWVPPTDGPFAITIPDKNGKPGESIAVQSFGLQFGLGCMDIIVLVLAEDEAPAHALMAGGEDEEEPLG